MNTPLYDAMRLYIEQDRARFHMPGHKGRGIPPFSEILPWDITEVAGADSLHDFFSWEPHCIRLLSL